MLNDKTYEYWHEIASHDKQAAELLIEAKAYPDVIIYHLHQAIEKQLKGLIVRSQDKLIYIHDLERLYKTLADLDNRYIDSMLETAIVNLHSYYSDLRYPQSDKLSEQDVLDAKIAFNFTWDKLV